MPVVEVTSVCGVDEKMRRQLSARQILASYLSPPPLSLGSYPGSERGRCGFRLEFAWLRAAAGAVEPGVACSQRDEYSWAVGLYTGLACFVFSPAWLWRPV